MRTSDVVALLPFLVLSLLLLFPCHSFVYPILTPLSFMNRDDIDFSNCGELPAAQELELVANAASMGDGGGIDYPLKVSKFQNVDSLTIFFSENEGSDVTSVSYVGFKGEVTTARHGVVECVYESAPQAADHKQDAGEFLLPDVSGN